MASTYALIDYENVQPNDLALLRGDRPEVKVKVFLGAHQSKIPVDLARAMQPLGERVEYIQIEGSGPNALDFHIAYYIGAISTREPTASFLVISKDGGFDPLIRHVVARGAVARRSASLSAFLSVESAVSAETNAQLDLAIAHLKKLKAAKPRAQKTLLGTLHNLFKKALSERQLADLLDALSARGYMKLDGTKVTYDLPDGK